MRPIRRRPPSPGVIVTGTDTGVGKTVAAAAVCRALAQAPNKVAREWRYWKPVQSGAEIGDDDTGFVQRWGGVPVHPPGAVLAAARSPDQAALREGRQLNIDQLLPPPSGRLVVEGAGGLLVPLNEKELMVDLFAQLNLPVLVVARSGLGTINHTLLTLEAAHMRGLDVRGVIFMGPPDAENRAAVERFGGTTVLACLPHVTLDEAGISELAGLLTHLPERLAVLPGQVS